MFFQFSIIVSFNGISAHPSQGKSRKIVQKTKKKEEKNIQEILNLEILERAFESDNLTLMKKHGKPIMKVNYLQNLALDIFKTINHLNQDYMKKSFIIQH